MEVTGSNSVEDVFSSWKRRRMNLVTARIEEVEKEVLEVELARFGVIIVAQ